MDPSASQPAISTALIADDDDQIRSDLITALRTTWPALRVVAEADNGADAWDLFLEREPDLCFLDVRMPFLTGIDVGQRIRGRSRLVLMSKASDPALDAVGRLGARHLHKPFDAQHVAVLIEDLRLLTGPRVPERWTGTEQRRLPTRRSARVDTIPGALMHGPREVSIDEIVYLEADGRFTRIVQASGELQTRLPLKEIVPQLDSQQFWQIHRHIVVNRRHVDCAMAIEGGAIVLTLKNRDERLPVGSHFMKRFKHAVQSDS